MSSRLKKTNFYRIVLQYIILLLLAYMVIRAWVDPGYQPDYEAYCPVGGLQSFSSFLVNNSLACTMTTLQIAMGLVLIAGVILLSKLFCSYICPIGTFTEWLGRIGEKRKIRYSIKGWADRLLRLLKYAMLFFSFYFTIRSSELFCKKFDPYYAVLSGFPGDVVVWWALIAIAVTIFGSLFIRQFWCKYLCFLGAATNLFAFTWLFLSITAIYLVLILLAGFTIPWFWYLAALCLGGFLIEAFKPETWIFPLLKVTRHEAYCTHCKICDKVCPYALEISTVDTVKHIDCHLCGDCVTQCPEKGALTYNRRKMPWLPAAALVVLVTAGILISPYYEIPTIDIKWGTAEQMENAGIFEQSGLMSVKCFGSSMSFYNQIKDVHGIIGVQTYVKHYMIRIFYDSALINVHGIKEAMFTPVKEIIDLPGEEVNQLFELDCGIDHFFDPNDASILSEMLKNEGGVYGFETDFGEPVKTLIFYDENKIKPARIKAVIETREREIEVNGKKSIQKLGFSVAWMKESPFTINRKDFLEALFKPYDKTFNDYEKTDTLSLSVYEIPFSESLYPQKKRWVTFLRNHLMEDKGIVRFQTEWRDDEPVLKIYFVPGKTTPASIYLSLTKPKLHITYKNGETEDIDNPFTFPETGAEVQVKIR